VFARIVRTSYRTNKQSPHVGANSVRPNSRKKKLNKCAKTARKTKKGEKIMKLNKVLSLVVVVVMLFTLSTFAAYQDVKSDASYSEAVDVLSALKILNGYEDGSFKPDGKITRGEFSKVVAGAIGLAESAKANATGGIFKDVAADLWSSGYIATAYQAGIVNGMGDGTFAPEAEVTYDQAVKMLVAALGYTPKATALGGYPTGYMMVANQEGITVGTANAAGGASRATVARLVYNALTVPMMDQTSFGKDAAFEKDPKQSLLYTKLNVVQADLTISTIELDKTKTDVTIEVKRTSDYDDVAIANGYVGNTYNTNGTLATTGTISIVKINGVDLKGLQGLMVSALIDVSDDSEPKLMAVTKKAGKNKELIVKPSLFKRFVTSGTSTNIEYFKTNSDDKETTEKSVTLSNMNVYKNLDKLSTDADKIAAVVATNTNAQEFKFVDKENDGIYDTVFVTDTRYFVIGSVNTATNKIFRDTTSTYSSSYTKTIFLDAEDDNLSWSLKDAVGKDLTLADLKAGQVLSITGSGDLTNETGLRYYDIVITEEKVEGKVTETYEELGKVTATSVEYAKIGDKDYRFFGTRPVAGDQISGIVAPNGKVIGYTVAEGVRNYGLVCATDYSNSLGTTAQIQLMTQKGEIVTLDLNKTLADAIPATGAADTTAAAIAAAKKANLETAYVNKLVVYELNTSGEIKAIWADASLTSASNPVTFVPDVAGINYYSINSEKVNGLVITDKTVVFTVSGSTLSDKKDVSLASKALFEEDTDYVTKAFKNTDGDATAIVVYNQGNKVRYDSYPFVVTSVKLTSVDGDSRTSVEGFVNGEKETLTFADSSDVKFLVSKSTTADAEAVLADFNNQADFDNFKKVEANDVFLYSVNGSKEITTIKYLVKDYTVVDNVYGATTAAKEDSKTYTQGKTVSFVNGSFNDLAPTVTATSYQKGFSVFGKAYDLKSKQLSIMNKTKFDASKVNPAVADTLARVYTGLADTDYFTINPNINAYRYDARSTMNKTSVASLGDLETDVSTGDYKILTPNPVANVTYDNDDLVYVYGYDDVIYFTLIIDKDGK
jgi:hypothetical protein